MAKDVIKEPFAVINGDDYYGKSSFRILADWLIAHKDSKGRCAIVGFELDNTLSENGTVSRGICSYDSDMKLGNITEFLNIGKEADGNVYGDNSSTGETHVRIEGTNLCSMNMWGFTPDYFELSERIFGEFLEENINELKKEFYIPFAVDTLIHREGYSCEVLSTDSRWFGVTFKEDRPGVVAKGMALAARDSLNMNEEDTLRYLKEASHLLATSRPTTEKRSGTPPPAGRNNRGSRSPATVVTR